jgi:hypothetical protein
LSKEGKELIQLIGLNECFYPSLLRLTKDIEQVRRLGLAMLGEKPKIEDVKYQIAQADLDGDGCLE